MTCQPFLEKFTISQFTLQKKHFFLYSYASHNFSLFFFSYFLIGWQSHYSGRYCSYKKGILENSQLWNYLRFLGLVSLWPKWLHYFTFVHSRFYSNLDKIMFSHCWCAYHLIRNATVVLRKILCSFWMDEH